MNRANTITAASSPRRPLLAFSVGLASLILLVIVDDPPSKGRVNDEVAGKITVAVADQAPVRPTAVTPREEEATKAFLPTL